MILDILPGYDVHVYLSFKKIPLFAVPNEKEVENFPIKEVRDIWVSVFVEVLCFYCHAINFELSQESIL